VPFSLSLVLIVLGGLFAWLSASTPHQLGAVVLTSGVIGLGFFLLHVISSGRWMGLGDAPIALALSLVAGKYAVAGLLFSFWIGAAIGIVILVLARKGHRMGIEVAFVPFLAAGYLLAFFTQWNPLNFL
jgi:prepilin signal peptidase PulO-like enzyme (type II secretory pathway)